LYATQYNGVVRTFKVNKPQKVQTTPTIIWLSSSSSHAPNKTKIHFGNITNKLIYLGLVISFVVGRAKTHWI